MIKFIDKKDNEIKIAFFSREDEEKIYVKFTSDGKEYGYFRKNIEIIPFTNYQLPFHVYTYQKECYKCHKRTEIITYITYINKPDKDVTFPWKKRRLLRHQNILAHLEDPSIEYYGINVIGDIEKFDNMLAEKFPDKIKKTYSKTQNRKYPMNICSHCGCGQGWYFIYRDINNLIRENKKIELYTY